jgi:formamidopyrimidine-DNA glycosylase
MPELPDLQVFSGNLEHSLKGKTVASVAVKNTKKIKSTSADFTKQLKGAKLKEVYREGKELHYLFDNGVVVGMHLMLHGQLYLFERKNEHKYSVIEMLFTDDTGLALTDYQGQAVATLNPEVKKSPDALSKEVNVSFLQEALGRTRTAVKTVLMNQDIIRGIGNAYADEILWDAGISPFSASNKIPADKIKELAKSVKKVLTGAEKQIKKAHPGIISGEYREFLDVHNAKKKQSPTGAAIRQSTAGGRKTYYTDEQELYK